MRRMPKTSSFKKGFTLIEIMVATVVMVIMVGLVVQITSEVLKVWTRSSDKLSANAQARIALDLITSDLETAVFRNNGLCWLEAKQEEVPNPLNIPTLQTTLLYLFAPALDRPKTDVNDNSVQGDICAISYELVYQDPVDGDDDPLDNTFALHRRLIDSKTTFESLLGEGNQETFTKWRQTGVGAEIPLPPPGNYPQTSDSGYFLASNIIDFRVDFYYVDAAGDSQLAPSVPSLAYGGTGSTLGPGSTNNFSIAYAEVKLRVLSNQAMDQLRRDPSVAQSGFDDLEQFIAANSEVYTRRVRLHSQPI